MEYSILILIIINFFHSISNGLTTPLVPPHLLTNGGSNITVGILIAGSFGLQLISKDFVAFFEHEKKFTIMYSLTTYFITNLILIFTQSHHLIIWCRFISALTDQVDEASKIFSTKIAAETPHIRIINLVDIAKTAGFAIGTIAGSYLYEWYSNFSTNAAIAAVLTLSSILLLQTVQEECYLEEAAVNWPIMQEECENRLKNLTTIDYLQHWEDIFLHLCYSVTFTIFFTNYCLILNYNYGSGVIVTGYTIVYQNMLLFACNWALIFLKPENFNIATNCDIFNHSLLLCGVSLLGMYYAPSHDCYLIIFIPLIMSYTMINSFLDDDILELKNKPEIYDGVITLTSISNVCIPLGFGVIGDLFGVFMVKIVAVLPPLLCILVANRRILRTQREKIKQD